MSSCGQFIRHAQQTYGSYLPPDELAEGATAELQPALAAL